MAGGGRGQLLVDTFILLGEGFTLRFDVTLPYKWKDQEIKPAGKTTVQGHLRLGQVDTSTSCIFTFSCLIIP